MILEVCVDSVESAVNAELGGADRIELCGDLIVGGTTPSLALYERIREKINIPIHVLLRPRFGDFLYSEEEIEILTRQAEAFSKAGADALVIGCLTADGQLDTEVLNRIMDAGKGTPYNLHRAFDMCRDLDETLETARKLGIVSILTSGGVASAPDGIQTLNRLKQNAGNVDIMAGAGINSQNLSYMLEHSCLTAFHMSAFEYLKGTSISDNASIPDGDKRQYIRAISRATSRLKSIVIRFFIRLIQLQDSQESFLRHFPHYRSVSSVSFLSSVSQAIFFSG